MKSWREKLNGYEFILWNLDRFEINSSIWVKQAFETKKYAFAADFIRLFAVYHYGGIYLDMDIEVVKKFDDLLHHKIMLAYENNDTKVLEAGCFGAEKTSPYIRKCIDYYDRRQFIRSDGSLDTLPLPQIMKKQLFEYKDDSISIYSSDYFTAKSFLTGKITISNDTYCIHHFAGSWLSERDKRHDYISRKILKCFGQNIFSQFIIRILYFIKRIKEIGVAGSIPYCYRKLFSARIK
jgi:mannosyltransferase OCH1-like enzyme